MGAMMDSGFYGGETSRKDFGLDGFGGGSRSVGLFSELLH